MLLILIIIFARQNSVKLLGVKVLNLAKKGLSIWSKKKKGTKRRKEQKEERSKGKKEANQKKIERKAEG